MFGSKSSMKPSNSRYRAVTPHTTVCVKSQQQKTFPQVHPSRQVKYYRSSLLLVLDRGTDRVRVGVARPHSPRRELSASRHCHLYNSSCLFPPSTCVERSHCDRIPRTSRVRLYDATIPTTFAGSLRDYDTAHTRARE